MEYIESKFKINEFSPITSQVIFEDIPKKCPNFNQFIKKDENIYCWPSLENSILTLYKSIPCIKVNKEKKNLYAIQNILTEFDWSRLIAPWTTDDRSYNPKITLFDILNNKISYDTILASFDTEKKLIVLPDYIDLPEDKYKIFIDYYYYSGSSVQDYLLNFDNNILPEILEVLDRFKQFELGLNIDGLEWWN